MVPGALLWGLPTCGCDWSRAQPPHPPAVTVGSPEEERKGEKIYLYTHLKQQPIW